MDSDWYVGAENKGRHLFGSLQTRLADPTAIDIACANLDIRYENNSWSAEPGIDDACLAALTNAGIGLEQGWELSNIYTRPRTSDTQESVYSNFMSAIEGCIVCVNNNKDKDTNEPGNRLQWSQAIFQVYEQLASKTHTTLKTLNTVWRCYIINTDTNKLITALMRETRNANGLPTRRDNYIEFVEGQSGFYALLGSPNGSGIVRMLTEFSEALGRKNILSVRIMERHSPPTLCFVLVDSPVLETKLPVTPQKPKLSVAGQKRRETRSAGKGKKYRRGDEEGRRMET